jgi:sirohydrochlorin cobaltochelatase
VTDHQALVLAGHGSHYNPDSARPTFEHADRIRERGAFAEVREAFWKEEPSLREVLRTVEGEVFVVPAFVSEGYFVGEVLPRELGLIASETNENVSKEDRTISEANENNSRANDDIKETIEYRLNRDRNISKDNNSIYRTHQNIGNGNNYIRFARPFGTHDAMTDVVVQRAREAACGLAGADVGLAVVGHGTERNPHSAEAIHYHADRIRERGTFGEVRALFMDEPPFVGDATDQFETDEIVAVPLFVADGFHTREEIPELLDLEPQGDGYRSPTVVGDHRIWYAGAVGSHPGVADVILERAADAGASLDSPPARLSAGVRAANGSGDGPTESVAGRARRAFLQWLEPGDGGNAANEATTRTWGQLAITTRVEDGQYLYELRHVDDSGRAPLDAVADPRTVRDRVRFDDAGAYRPLSGAPTLPTGWVCADLDARNLVRAVEFVYPASVENWHLEQEGDLDVSHFRETAERQTGIYEVVAELDSDELAAAVEACCADGACIKRRAWDESEGETIPAERGAGKIPCREPCSLFVAAARAFVREERDGEAGPDAPDPDAPDANVRVGNVDHEANPYRVRYRRAKQRADERPAVQASVGGEPR